MKDIHNKGGTILVSDRGAPPTEDMVKVLAEQGVRQYFVLGGDGTHAGAMASFEACGNFLYCARLYYTILYYTILYYTIPYYTIPYYTILYHTRLYYTTRKQVSTTI